MNPAPLPSARIPEHLELAERRHWRELLTFEEGRVNTSSLLGRLASTPFQALIPASLHQGMRRALQSVMDVARTGGSWTVSPEAVLGEHLLDLDSFRERALLATVLSLCEEQTGPSMLSATLQGAGLGLGGVTLALADVPLLLTLHLRLLVQLGFCCGFDLRPVPERAFLLALLELGYCLQDWEERRRAIRDLNRGLFGGGLLPEGEPDDVLRSLLQKSVGNFVEKVVPILVRRRASTVLPLLGGVIGAGANYTLTRDVAEAGTRMLVKRLLVERAGRRAREGAA